MPKLPMSAERQLREKVRQVLRSGRLPDRGPDQIWGGLGSGGQCSICEAIIEDGEIELEIRFRRADGAAIHTLHLRCFSIYEDERQHQPRLQVVDGTGAQEGA